MRLRRAYLEPLAAHHPFIAAALAAQPGDDINIAPPADYGRLTPAPPDRPSRRHDTPAAPAPHLLGDRVADWLRRFGITAAVTWLRAGRPCACALRQSRLNRLTPLLRDPEWHLTATLLMALLTLLALL